MATLLWTLPWALLSGCADPDVICDFNDDGFESNASTDRRELQRTGSVVLPPGQTRATQRFRITVSGLSEIGTSHAQWGASFVRVRALSRYGAGAPVGAELPDVDVALSRLPPGADAGHAPSPVASAALAGPGFVDVDIFHCNGSPAEGCCELGEPECDNAVELTLSRDDALFPEVTVDWEATFRAEFSRCEGEPPLRLEVEEVPP